MDTEQRWLWGAKEKPVRALVLSGGGGRGAYECGVYK